MQILVLCKWWILSIISNFKFCMPFFMLSWFNLKYFWELVKIAIFALFCKITCKIWILMHDMHPAILFLFFYIYILKKKIKKKFQKKIQKNSKKKFKKILNFFLNLLKHQNCIYRKGSGRWDLDQHIKHEKTQLWMYCHDEATRGYGIHIGTWILLFLVLKSSFWLKLPKNFLKIATRSDIY